MIRVVVDTNVLVSALLQPLGPPARVLLLARDKSIELCISAEIYAEYEEVLARPRLDSTTRGTGGTFPLSGPSSRLSRLVSSWTVFKEQD